jgi:multisubunit Na+/H+ antiporter MnhG subunit
MSIAALIVSIVTFCLATFTLLAQLGIIKISTPQNDKYAKYRNSDGLYSARRNKGVDEE